LKKEKFFKHNNLLPIIVAVISSLTSFGVAYLQFGGKNIANKVEAKKFLNEQIDLKLAPVNVKVDNLSSLIMTFNTNQQMMNQNIIDILKQLGQKDSEVSFKVKRAEKLQISQKQK
jgi:hypothetical protein